MAFVLLLVALLSGAQSSAPASALPSAAMNRAGWLVGCWHSSNRGSATTHETWIRVGENLLVGRSSTTLPGLAPDFTFSRLESADGSLVLVDQPPGAAPVRYALDAASPIDELRFVASAPPGAGGRITFTRGKDDELKVTRDRGGAMARAAIALKKTDCRR